MSDQADGLRELVRARSGTAAPVRDRPSLARDLALALGGLGPRVRRLARALAAERPEPERTAR